jgi:hypothetical protein
MNTTQTYAFMVFGIVVALAGLALLFLRKEREQNTIKILGQEFQISTPALVVVILGCALFAGPFVISLRQSAPDQQPQPAKISTIPTPPPTPIGSDLQKPLAGKDTIEPNDDFLSANVIEFGKVYRGSLDLRDPSDFFVLSSLDKVEPLVLNINNLSTILGLEVNFYDKDKNALWREVTSNGGADMHVPLKTLKRNEKYYVQVTRAYGEGAYELSLTPQ